MHMHELSGDFFLIFNGRLMMQKQFSKTPLRQPIIFPHRPSLKVKLFLVIFFDFFMHSPTYGDMLNEQFLHVEDEQSAHVSTIYGLACE